MSRPELTGDASLHYNEREARKYDTSSRMIGIQREITERAMELLRLNNNASTTAAAIPTPKLILDIGCGSGLSGRVIEEYGHVWIGCDISRDMLNVASERQLKVVGDGELMRQEKNGGGDAVSSREGRGGGDDEMETNMDESDDYESDDDDVVDGDRTGNRKLKDRTKKNGKLTAVGDLIHHVSIHFGLASCVKPMGTIYERVIDFTCSFRWATGQQCVHRCALPLFSHCSLLLWPHSPTRIWVQGYPSVQRHLTHVFPYQRYSGYVTQIPRIKYRNDD